MCILTAGASLTGCTSDKDQKVSLGFTEVPITTEKQDAQVDLHPITVVPVEVLKENRTLRLTGTLTPDEQSNVASRVGGMVQEVLVDRGSVVKKGELLVKIDATNAENYLAEGLASIQEIAVRLGLKDTNEKFSPAQQPEVKSAKASLNLAEITFQRNRQLHEKQVISTAELDRARSEYETARQRHEQAWSQAAQLYQSYQTARVRIRTLQQAVEDTSVTAPFAGMVSEKHVAPGETLGAGMAGPGGGGRVMTLLRIDPLRLLVTVPGRSISQVTPGQRVEFQVDAFPGRTFTGAIIRVSPALEAETRSLTVEASVANEDKLLRPGMFATAQLVLPEQKKSVFVPESAVIRRGDIARIFVVEDGIAREKVVTIEGSDADRVQISTGLEPGDRVIAEASRVSDGMRVQ